MKPNPISLIFLLLVGCDYDLPNQFTSVEGTVSDYYTQQPLAGISVIVRKDSNCFMCPDIVLNTIIADELGYYYYDFYNDTNRVYHVETLKSELYFFSNPYKIIEGKENTIDIAIKPYKTLNVSLQEQMGLFNQFSIYSYTSEDRISISNLYQDTVLKLRMVPEYRNVFSIGLHHLSIEHGVDTSYTILYEIEAGRNDTTIIWNY